jgi:hypothetical protein
MQEICDNEHLNNYSMNVAMNCAVKTAGRISNSIEYTSCFLVCIQLGGHLHALSTLSEFRMKIEGISDVWKIFFRCCVSLTTYISDIQYFVPVPPPPRYNLSSVFNTKVVEV